MRAKITLDPGHGRYGNVSSNNPKYIEGVQMWKLSGKLKVALEKYDFEVVTTRPKISDDPTVYDRGLTAGENDSDMFLSLHSNAPGMSADGTYNKDVTGSVVYYSITRPENKTLADKLGNKVSEIMGHYYRGSLTREYPNKPDVDYYGVLRSAAQSGCKCAMIIEHGFHTNLADSNFLLDDGNLQKLAEAEAAIIAEYFGQTETKKPAASTPINPTAPLEIYRVRKTWEDAKSQLGSYMILDYAKACVDKNPGFYVFDSKGNIVYPTVDKKTVDELAREVILGKWGNGSERKRRLTQAGYDYSVVQKRVNELLK